MSKGTSGQSAYEPLRHRDYALMWSSGLISASGTWLQNAALGWFVFDISGSPFWVSMVQFAQFSPMLALGPIGGLLADRFPRRRVILVTQSALMLLACVLAALAWSNRASVATVLPCVTLSGIAMSFNAPSSQALVSDIVPRSIVLEAVALFAAQAAAARALGPLVGGVVLARWGAGWSFLLNALSFLPVIVALSMIRPTPQQPQRAEARRAFIDAVRTVLEQRALLIMIVAMATVSFFSSAPIALLPVLARETLHLGAGAFSVLAACTSLGALAGALMTSRLVRRIGMRATLLADVASLSVLLLVIALSRWVLLTGVGFALMGCAYAMALSATSTGLQTKAPPEMRGRVMSFHTMSFAGLYPVGALVAGTLATRTDVVVTLACFAAPPLAVAAGLAVLGRGLEID